jgi:hypothetical protein
VARGGILLPFYDLRWLGSGVLIMSLSPNRFWGVTSAGNNKLNRPLVDILQGYVIGKFHRAILLGSGDTFAILYIEGMVPSHRSVLRHVV